MRISEAVKIFFENLTLVQRIIAGVVALALIAALLVVIGVIPGLRREVRGPKAVVTIWGPASEGRAMSAVMKRFEEQYPDYALSYGTFADESYERELLDKLAGGTGPDIFFFHSSWRTKHGNKVSPTSSPETIAALPQLFPQVVASDFTDARGIYALPLYIDSLALYVNRNLLDKRGVTRLPATWADLRYASREKNFPVGLGGGAETTPLVGDIVNLLLLQHGVSPGGGSGESVVSRAAEEALGVYTSFPAPKTEVTSGFLRGEIGAILGYASLNGELYERSAGIPWEVLPAPQVDLENPAAQASYYGLAVWRGSRQRETAWGVVGLLTGNASLAETYGVASGHPPALRYLIDRYSEAKGMGIFARQALIARSWAEPGREVTRQVFARAVADIRDRGASLQSALSAAAESLRTAR